VHELDTVFLDYESDLISQVFREVIHVEMRVHINCVAFADNNYDKNSPEYAL